MKKIKVKITTTEPMLGMTPASPELYEQFLALKEKKLDVRRALNEEKKEEELQALRLERDEQAQENRGITVFPRDTDGTPIFWDFHFKGFLKDTFKALLQSGDKEWSKTACPLNPYNVAKRVDQLMFPEPRRIRIDIPEGTEITRYSRPLRKPDTRNREIESSAIASSECIDAGATLEVTFTILNDQYLKYVKYALDYGKFRGLGQRRNDGFGRFTYEIVEES